MSTVSIVDTPTTHGIGYEVGPSGGSPITGVPAVATDPTKEYMAGGSGYDSGMGELALPEDIDDLTRLLGSRTYKVMKNTPAVASSLRTLKLGILAGEFQMIPTFPIKPGQKEPEPDQVSANDVADFCQRLIDRASGFRDSILQLLDAAEEGNKLGEITGEVVEGGDDDGRMMLKHLKVKKRSSWQFIVDRSYNVTGILARGLDGSRKRYPPDKFLWLTWFPEDSDPRGTSILRPVYAAWQFLARIYPQWLKFLYQCAVRSLWAKTAPGAINQKLPDGRTVSATEHLGYQLKVLQNASYIVLPSGAEIGAIEQGEGAAFHQAFDYLDRQMIYGILMQTRATKEAENGSKADSETGMDVMGLLKEYGRQLLGTAIRDRLLKPFVAFNFGPEWAERFTPYFAIGSSDPSDLVARWNAFAGLVRAGAITPSIAAEAYSLAGLPVPDQEADEEAAQAAFERSQQAAGAEADDTGEDGSEGDEDAIPGDVPDVERKAA